MPLSLFGLKINLLGIPDYSFQECYKDNSAKKKRPGKTASGKREKSSKRSAGKN